MPTKIKKHRLRNTSGGGNDQIEREYQDKALRRDGFFRGLLQFHFLK
jgi:hypothetical protein